MSPRKRLEHRRKHDPCEPDHQGSRRAEHPLTCGCRACMAQLGSELVDPDAMEDEDQPYFWNRRLW